MFAYRWSHVVVSALTVTVAAAALADDVYVEKGVVVKPLSKFKQRRLEKKLLRRPGNQVVIEGAPTASPSPEAMAGFKARRAFRPLFPNRFERRNEVVTTPSVVSIPSTVVTNSGTVVSSTPRTNLAPGDPLVLPGSVEVTPSTSSSPRLARPPVVSTPKGQILPMEPIDEPTLEDDRPASARILPPPADEIPPPVISVPRRPSNTPPPAPTPAPAPASDPSSVPAPASALPSVDPGPSPSTTPPPAPEPATTPTAEPALELPQGTPRPA